MPPAGPGGRPRNAWNPSRERKLVRLYTLTKLNKEEIRKVLESPGFDPSSNDIQKKLRSLFPPDYAKNHRRFRPLNGDNMTLRFDHLRRCKKGRVSKEKWFRCLAMSKTRLKSDVFRGELSTQLDSFEGYSHAFRNYAESAPGTASIAFSSDLMNSQLVRPSLLLLDGSSMAPTRNHPTITNTTESHQERLSDRRPPALRISSPLSPISSIVQQFPSVSGLQESSEMQSAKLHDLGKRLASKYSDSYLKHVHSVLRYSSSNSWRSSLTSLSSGTSSFRSKSTTHDGSTLDGTSIRPDTLSAPNMVLNQEAGTIKDGRIRSELKKLRRFSLGSSSPLRHRNLKSARETRLTVAEQEIWRDLVDERAIEPLLPSRPKYLSVSPLHRDCCKSMSRSQGDLAKEDVCKLCGFSPRHRYAIKFGWTSYYRQPYILNILDFYGNTPLHCGAATVKESQLPKISNMIERGCDVNIRNTSGETFLHVLCYKGITTEEAGEGFLLILRSLSKLKFRFSTRDYHGRTALHNFLQSWPSGGKYSIDFLSRIFAIMEPDLSVRDNAGVTPFKLLKDMANRVPDDAYDKELEARFAPFYYPSSSPSPYWAEFMDESLKNALAESRHLGGNPLTSIIKMWKPDTDNAGELSLEQLVKRMITRGDAIHMRDGEGNTPLALAARRGFRIVVNLLLAKGANVHSRDYYGIGILKQLQESLALAVGNPKLWARILACHIALTDAGAKINPTEQDEWALPWKRSSVSEPSRRTESVGEGVVSSFEEGA